MAALSEQLAQLRTALSAQLSELTGPFKTMAAETGDLAPEEPTLLVPPPPATAIASVEPEIEAAVAVRAQMPTPERPQELPTRRVRLINDGPFSQQFGDLLAQHHCESVPVSTANAVAPELEHGRAEVTVFNLGTPNTWRMVCKARGGPPPSGTALIAYLREPTAERSLWLGRVDFAELPRDKEHLRDIINAMVPRTKRVILLAGDIDRMGDIREHLLTQGISAALVFDDRQLVDLTPTVRPGVVILHISPTCPDVFRAILALRTRKEHAEIPLLFLFDAAPDKAERAFLERGIKMLSARATRDTATLVSATLWELRDKDGAGGTEGTTLQTVPRK